MSLLSARSLVVRRGDATVLAGVDLELQPGSVTLIAGRNGAGKTTLIHALAGLLQPERGEVRLDGRALTAISFRERARQLALVPQQTESPFEFTGRELVMMGRHPYIPRFGGPREADHAAVTRALERVRAEAFADRSVRSLSGGERQRIDLARALATEAPVLLADEPSANLDLEHALAIVRLLRELARQGRTIVVASHDLNLVAPHVDRVVLLHHGRAWFEGTPQDALASQRVEEVFGVRSGDPSGFFPRDFR